MNEEKTQVIFITKRRTRQLPHRPFEIGSTQIEWSNTIKYLGVTFDKILTFRQHIDNVLKRTHTVTKILYSLLCRKSHLNTNNKILLYKACLRPIFTYATPAISKYSKFTYQKTTNLSK